jgi:predicted dehydrogenase
MITVALIGVSGYAHFHYQDLVSLTRQGRIKLVAAVVINQDEEKAKCEVLRGLGCELYTDYSVMLTAWNGRLTLCVVPTGIHLHAPMTIAALRAGCNVLVEKPAAATVAEVDLMRKTEIETSRFVAVGFQHIYSSEIRRIKQHIVDGFIGRIEVIKCRGMWPRSRWYYTRNEWAGRLKFRDAWVLDAPFNNAFAHWLNLLCFLPGSHYNESATPTTVQAELYRASNIESADTACLRIETEEEVPLLLWVTHSCCPHQKKNDGGPELEVRGTNGSITWNPTNVTYRLKDGTEERWPTGDVEETRFAMMDAVLRKASGKTAFVCGLDIARMQTLCSNAAFKSSRINEIAATVQFDGKPDDPFSVIEGIEGILTDAYHKEKLWSEMPVPWARSGKKVALGKYRKGNCFMLAC